MSTPTPQQVVDVLTLRAGAKQKEADEYRYRSDYQRTFSLLAGEAAAYADAANLVHRMLIDGKPPL